MAQGHPVWKRLLAVHACNASIRAASGPCPLMLYEAGCALRTRTIDRARCLRLIGWRHTFRALVIPAKAGIHSAVTNSNAKWIPAFTAMRGWPKATKGEAVALLVYDTRLLDHPNPAKPSAISAKLAGSGSAASVTAIE